MGQSLGNSYRLVFLIITAQRPVWFTQVHICIPWTFTWITWWNISPNGSIFHFQSKCNIDACKNPHQDTLAQLPVHFWKSESKSNTHSPKTRLVLCPLKPQCLGHCCPNSWHLCSTLASQRKLVARFLFLEKRRHLGSPLPAPAYKLLENAKLNILPGLGFPVWAPTCLVPVDVSSDWQAAASPASCQHTACPAMACLLISCFTAFQITF